MTRFDNLLNFLWKYSAVCAFTHVIMSSVDPSTQIAETVLPLTTINAQSAFPEFTCAVIFYINPECAHSRYQDLRGRVSLLSRPLEDAAIVNKPPSWLGQTSR